MGEIIIDPLVLDHISPASFTFTLGVNLLQPVGDGVIDFRKNILPEYRKIVINEESGYQLKPDEFILAQTAEKITLSPRLVMIIEGRSYLARTGLEVVQTSTFIEPTHNNSIITLEVKNNGKNPIMLYPGMSFAKGIFIELSASFTGQFGDTTYKTQLEVEPPKP